MKLNIVHLWIFSSLFIVVTAWSQVRAGSPESQLFDQLFSETNADTKLELVASFERQYPKSAILPRVYLAAIDVHRERGVRDKMIEYGEKVLALDQTNVTAMMVLARNYSMETSNLDRAVDLAQKAVEHMEAATNDPAPIGYSQDQWANYQRTTKESAKQILAYAKAMKARSEAINKPASTSAATPPGATTASTSSPTDK
jgi:tetratricopeptide (TPR) repeat protein